jgi:hypothetical protein
MGRVWGKGDGERESVGGVGSVVRLLRLGDKKVGKEDKLLTTNH